MIRLFCIMNALVLIKFIWNTVCAKNLSKSKKTALRSMNWYQMLSGNSFINRVVQGWMQTPGRLIHHWFSHDFPVGFFNVFFFFKWKIFYYYIILHYTIFFSKIRFVANISWWYVNVLFYKINYTPNFLCCAYFKNVVSNKQLDKNVWCEFV